MPWILGTSSPWLAFTGLIPVVLMVPILLLHWYAFGVIVAVVGCVGVVVYHLSRGGVTSLDVLALVFAAANVVLYFVVGNTWLIKHVAVVFYSLLAAQCAVSLARQQPWTMQFTRRVVTPEFAADPRFRAMNTWTTVVWTAAFAACDALTLSLAGAAANWLPVAVMAAAVVISRLTGRLYLARAGVDLERASAAS